MLYQQVPSQPDEKNSSCLQSVLVDKWYVNFPSIAVILAIAGIIVIESKNRVFVRYIAHKLLFNNNFRKMLFPSKILYVVSWNEYNFRALVLLNVIKQI